MKLSHRLTTLSVAVLMGVSPVASLAVCSTITQAASTSVYKTYGKNSLVHATKTMKFVNANGHKTSKTAYKGGRYVIWDVKNIDGEAYFSIQSNLKYWLPATATRGRVQYKSSGRTVTITTDGAKVLQRTTSTKASSKRSSKRLKKRSELLNKQRKRH